MNIRFLFIQNKENFEKSFENSSRTGQFCKKKELILNNSPCRLVEAAKVIDPVYKKKSKLIENVSIDTLEKSLNYNPSTVSSDEAIKLKNEMGISTRQYALLLKLMREKSPGLFPSLNKIKERECEILPPEYIETQDYMGQIDLNYSIKISIILILKKNWVKIKPMISEERLELRINYCIKIGNTKKSRISRFFNKNLYLRMGRIYHKYQF